MLPSPSMMKPLPAPRCGGAAGGPSGASRGSGGSIAGRPRRRPRSRPRAVASMFTTAGLIRSTMSAKLTRPFSEALACASVRPGTAALLAGAPADTAERATPPATIAPTRNATNAVSTTVTMVKRLDISLHYKGLKRGFVEDLDAKFLGLVQLGARVGASHDIVGFLAHRPRDLRAQTVERLGRFLAG